jgi:amino-acid N-acetyltransferase
MISIEPALTTDRAAIEGLLETDGLPLDGLELALSTAVVARDGIDLVGCAAVEPYGSVGLLRSVCVAPALRGAGWGRRLVDAAESMASSRGMTELYLLTETAVEWFPRLGYSPATRADVPAAVTASPEFTGACPDSAAVFRKQI